MVSVFQCNTCHKNLGNATPARKGNGKVLCEECAGNIKTPGSTSEDLKEGSSNADDATEQESERDVMGSTDNVQTIRVEYKGFQTLMDRITHVEETARNERQSLKEELNAAQELIDIADDRHEELQEAYDTFLDADHERHQSLITHVKRVEAQARSTQERLEGLQIEVGRRDWDNEMWRLALEERERKFRETVKVYATPACTFLVVIVLWMIVLWIRRVALVTGDDAQAIIIQRVEALADFEQSALQKIKHLEQLVFDGTKFEKSTLDRLKSIEQSLRQVMADVRSLDAGAGKATAIEEVGKGVFLEFVWSFTSAGLVFLFICWYTR